MLASLGGRWGFGIFITWWFRDHSKEKGHAAEQIVCYNFFSLKKKKYKIEIKWQNKWWCFNIKWQAQTWNVSAGLECHSDALCSYHCASDKCKLIGVPAVPAPVCSWWLRTQTGMDCANNRFLFRGTQDGKYDHKVGKLGLVDVSLSMAGRLELDLWGPFQPKSFSVSIIPWNQLSYVPLLALNRITDNRLQEIPLMIFQIFLLFFLKQEHWNYDIKRTLDLVLHFSGCSSQCNTQQNRVKLKKVIINYSCSKWNRHTIIFIHDYCYHYGQFFS